MNEPGMRTDPAKAGGTTAEEPATDSGRPEAPSYRLLLAQLPEDVRNSFQLKLLGPLLAYDAAHRSKLVLTLEAFLAHSGSWSAAAQELHLHVNTLRYRVGRIHQLTGRDPSRLEDQVDLFLALRAAQMNRRRL